MIYLLYFLHVIVCVFLILVVLVQQGKGADLSVFGGGGTMTAFGARGASTLLHKLTVASFVMFIFTVLTLAILQGGSRGSVMSGLKDKPASAPVSVPATAPTSAPAVAPVAPPVAPAPQPAQPPK
ncbi:MAG: preprotein translocase subunit SecG [Acidobacteriota bacterium]